MARIDTFLAQLMAYEAEALLIESGDNLYLVKSDQRMPLMQVRAGAIANAHVAALLGEIAPAYARAQLESGAGLEWDYQWGTCLFHVEVANVGGRIRARLYEASRDEAGGSVSAVAPLDDGGGAEEAPHIERFMRAALERGCTDLHLTAGRLPMVRVDGEMTGLPGFSVLDPYALQKMIEEILPDRAKAELEATHDVDFSYDLAADPQRQQAGARIRCNIFRDVAGVGGVFRCFPLQAQSVRDIGVPDVVVEMCAQRHGLIVVTGAAGSGKSTTLAALVDWINEHRADHVVTIEEPVEIVHAPKRCLINQRQVGEHTGSFARALRAAQREDPDVVLVGEARDADTLAAVLEMAETHLVLVCLRTSSAAAALDRIVDRFPLAQQQQVRHQLADCLLGVVAQSLQKRASAIGGAGRFAVFDVLAASPSTSALIRDGQAHNLSRARAVA